MDKQIETIEELLDIKVVDAPSGYDAVRKARKAGLLSLRESLNLWRYIKDERYGNFTRVFV